MFESRKPLQPEVDHHIVIRGHNKRLQIWIDGALDREVQDELDCTGNISDVFIRQYFFQLFPI